MRIAVQPVVGWGIVALILGTSACSAPPRGVAGDPATDETRPVESAPAAESSPGGVYDLESEGEFDQDAPDVVFAEDELPPRPEDLKGNTLDQASVASEDVDQEDLPEPSRATPTEAVAPTVTTPVPPSVSTPVQTGAGYEVLRGFRVQLLALEDRMEAERAGVEAEQRLGAKVYVVFESPYFKLRLGDFEDRVEAQGARDRAKANGYPEAWVVTDEIRRVRGQGS